MYNVNELNVICIFWTAVSEMSKLSSVNVKKLKKKEKIAQQRHVVEKRESAHLFLQII